MTAVSVVLPTYNEAQTVRGVVSSLRSQLQQHARSHEIIVVDDDSPDGTASKVRAVWQDSPHVRLIVRKNASGLASAVVRGFHAADGDTYAVMDADGQHNPAQLPALVIQVADGGADLVVGSRRGATGRVEDDWPVWRRIISHGATLLAWAAVPPARETSDPMSGFFAVDAAVVDPVIEELRPCGYKILLEVLGRAPVDDVAEVGYTFRSRDGGESNLSPREYVRYLRHLARLAVPSRRATRAPAVPAATEVDD